MITFRVFAVMACATFALVTMSVPAYATKGRVVQASGTSGTVPIPTPGLSKRPKPKDIDVSKRHPPEPAAKKRELGQDRFDPRQTRTDKERDDILKELKQTDGQPTGKPLKNKRQLGQDKLDPRRPKTDKEVKLKLLKLKETRDGGGMKMSAGPSEKPYRSGDRTDQLKEFMKKSTATPGKNGKTATATAAENLKKVRNATRSNP